LRVTSAGSCVLLAWRVASLSGGEACRPCSFSMLLRFVFPDCLAHPFGSRIRSEGCGAEGTIGGGLISAWSFLWAVVRLRSCLAHPFGSRSSGLGDAGFALVVGRKCKSRGKFGCWVVA